MKSSLCFAVSSFGVVIATCALGCTPEENIGMIPPGSSSSSSGAPCGSVRTLASGLTYPAAMARQGDYLYVLTQDPDSNTPSSPGTGMLYKVPVAGGKATILATGLGATRAITTDATSVYWTSGDDTVKKLPFGGGQPTVIAAAQKYLGSIVVDATYAYWATEGKVMKAPLAGGPPSVVFSPGATGVFDIGPIAIDSTNLYFKGLTSGASAVGEALLIKAPLDGGAPMTYPAKAGENGAVAVDASSIYWTDIVMLDQMDPTQGAVMRMPIDGSGSPVVVVTQPFPTALALDATGVYASGGLIYQKPSYSQPTAVTFAPLAGGATQILATAVSWGLATCPGGLCWTDMEKGTVMRYERCSP